MSKITKFPINTWERIRNQRGKGSVSCEVSGRWLRFSEKNEKQDFGTPVWLDVMTDAAEGDRKLCQLCVTVEELERVLEHIKGK